MTHRLPGEFINILEKGSSEQEYWCFPTLRHENIKPDQAFRDKQDFFPPYTRREYIQTWQSPTEI